MLKTAYVLGLLYGNIIGEVKGFRYEQEFGSLAACQTVEAAYRQAKVIVACVPLEDAVNNGYQRRITGPEMLREINAKASGVGRGEWK